MAGLVRIELGARRRPGPARRLGRIADLRPSRRPPLPRDQGRSALELQKRLLSFPALFYKLAALDRERRFCTLSGVVLCVRSADSAISVADFFNTAAASPDLRPPASSR